MTAGVPADLEAEDHVIAACLVDPQAIAECVAIVAPMHFFREKNGEIFAGILDVWRRGEDVNQVTIAHELAKKNGLLEDVGGMTYLAQIIRALPTSVGADWYARLIRRAWQHRQLISAGDALMARARAAVDEPAAIADAFIERLIRSGVARDRPLTRSAAQVLAGTTTSPGLDDRLILAANTPGALPGIATGWDRLDEIMGGLVATRLYVVLGDTSGGKSFLVHWVAWNIACGGTPVHIVSTEMSADEVIERLVWMQAGLDPVAIRERGVLTTGEERAVTQAIGEVATLPLYVTDVGAISLDVLSAEVRRQRATHETAVVFVDHIQHVAVPSARGRPEVLEAVAAGLKGLAMNVDVPVVAVSHVGREAVARTGTRDDSRPRALGLHSAKGSSSIEQDANVVIALQTVRFEAGKWAPMAEEQADAFKARGEYLPVRATLPKNRRGARAWDVRVIDWNLGGRFMPLREGRYNVAAGGSVSGGFGDA